jgi:hypothetical protein
VGFDSNVVLLSPDNQKLFVTNQSSHTVTTLDVLPTGRLSLASFFPFDFTQFAIQPGGMATDLAGTRLYVASFASKVMGLNISPEGVLSVLPGSPYITPVGSGLLSLATYPAKTCAYTFDLCIQDANNLFQLNSQTGQYKFSNCSGFTLSGTGTVVRRGSTTTLQHNSIDRRIQAVIDLSSKKASASIQSFTQGKSFTLTDTDISNNTCVCNEQSSPKRVPADYSTIQKAINASVNGDTVLVAPGTYVERIDFSGKAIKVTSEAGPEVTIIDANRTGSTVTFQFGESRSAELSGFTIRNGLNQFFGGGILISNSSPTILRNIITGNMASSGNGIAVSGLSASPLIQNNVISLNSMTGASGGPGGGGILVFDGGHPQIIANTISDNSVRCASIGGGGISIFGGGTTLILGNRIINNSAESICGGESSGGGIYVNTYTPQFITQNLVAQNRASSRGGGIWLSGVIDSAFGVKMVNNTIVDNLAPLASGVYASAFNANEIINNIIVASPGQIAFYCLEVNPGVTGVFKFNNVFASGGMAYGGTCPPQTGVNGNISADPSFVNSLAGDFHLRSDSPSIDRGDNTAPNLPATDLDGHPRIADGNFDGLKVVDMEALELPAPYDVCIQDESNGNLLIFNSQTGDYQFYNCRGGVNFTGRGAVRFLSCKIEFNSNDSNAIISALVNTCTKLGNASIQASSKIYLISDSDMSNNTCRCR